ncbi:uncharacterized protein LOC132202444 [Neocloeon triangulifer]|uniref:uncharacterized protein LOC132202444 n=1 Tax=Neocloeon triangulifer TaxID=2078957 RepID=UPI00286EE041|nr:uncharacterized protein LOC132202444 [Neocloeon triangulifer]
MCGQKEMARRHRQQLLLSLPLLLLFLFCSECRGLRLMQLSIPPYASLGMPVAMGCTFDTEDANLYSVKWYKDNAEFCRYMPSQHPSSLLFPVPGIIMDESGCQMASVQLREATLETTGTYLCEVSTEKPNFETKVRLANLTVRALPSESPHISNMHSSYAPGEWVLATCTAAKSLPAAELQWMLNGQPVDSLWVTTSVLRANGHSGDDDEDILMDSSYYGLDDRRNPVAHLLPREDEPHLEATKSIIRFQARPEYFTGPKREFSLRCMASIHEHVWRAERRPTLAGLGGNQRLARHEEPHNAASGRAASPMLLLLLLRIILDCTRAS